MHLEDLGARERQCKSTNPSYVGVEIISSQALPFKRSVVDSRMKSESAHALPCDKPGSVSYHHMPMPLRCPFLAVDRIPASSSSCPPPPPRSSSAGWKSSPKPYANPPSFTNDRGSSRQRCTSAYASRMCATRKPLRALPRRPSISLVRPPRPLSLRPCSSAHAPQQQQLRHLAIIILTNSS